jgi:hypothetical protein
LNVFLGGLVPYEEEEEDEGGGGEEGGGEEEEKKKKLRSLETTGPTASALTTAESSV